MDNKTVRKTSEARQTTTEPSEGGPPSKKTTADIGALSKGSSGRPKAEAGKNREGAGGRSGSGATPQTKGLKINKTTSTNLPGKPVPANFMKKLGEMHTAEKELTLALPLMVKAAKSKDLKTLLRIHLKETKSHVKALEQVGGSLGEELPEQSCKPMTQLIKEGVKVIAKRLVSSDQDDALIAVGQKIEQFEIDSYTPLCETAKQREYTHERALLTSILNQEKLASDLLGQLSRGEGPLKDLVEKTSLKHGVSG